MKKKYIFILAFICVFYNFSYGENVKTDDVLSKIETADKNIRDMEFNFMQTISYVSTGEKQASSGIVKYKKQNYIYMFQKKPCEQHTYIDGKKMTVYVPANKQAVVENWKDVLNSDMILTMLVGFGKNFRSFEKNNLIILEESQNNKEYRLLMKPKDSGQLWEMHINIGKETLLVNSAEFDNKNFIIDVELKGYKLNTGVGTDIFRFKPEKDIEVIEL
ncbi:MAG: outer-membrane lipoprotein carrier protein LolA [Endomicrobiaceae bacterium]